jgi:hypothetical protein
MRRHVAAVCGAVALALTGCGYRDDNPDAARVLAQALLDAQHAGDADAVCRLLGPALLAATASQGGGNCQPFVQRSFDPSTPALRAGSVAGDDTRMRVQIQDRPGLFIGVVKYASVWRVEEASVLNPR